MRPTPRSLAGGQFNYPKEVWTPSGGWWTRPTNWKQNTAVALGLNLVLGYFLFRFSGERETRDYAPNRWIPSMLWSREFIDGKVTARDEEKDWPKGAYVPKGHH